MHEHESEKKKRPEEILEAGVSRIEPRKHTCKHLASILLRFTLAIVFLSFGVGAVFYSVVHSEEIAEAESVNQHLYGEYFNFFNDQSSADGVLTVQHLVSLDEHKIATKNISQIGVSWKQDHSNKRIVHQVGLNGSDWKYTYFVYADYSIYANKEVCIRNSNQTYESFLRDFHLSNLPKARHERILLEGNSRPITVELFQGSPAVIKNSQTAYNYFTDSSPYFATTYTKSNNGLVYGWQTYFKTTNNSDVLWIEYWFPHMKQTVLDASEFFDYPPHCIVQTV